MGGGVALSSVPFLLPPMPAVSLQIIREEHASIAAKAALFASAGGPGAGDNPPSFFDGARAILFYIDEFPEREHHPKESEHLFPAWRSGRPMWPR